MSTALVLHVYVAHGQHVHRLLRLSCFVCLSQIVHTALAAFNIVMQQYSQQLSAEPLPLNVTKRHNHSSITYRATYVNKVVEWASFANADEAGLMQVGALILRVACTPSSASLCNLADHPAWHCSNKVQMSVCKNCIVHISAAQGY